MESWPYSCSSCACAPSSRRIANAADIAGAIVLPAANPNLTGTVIETGGGTHLTT